MCQWLIVVNEPFRSGVVVALSRAVPEPVKPPSSAAMIATNHAFGSLIFISDQQGEWERTAVNATSHSIL